MATGVAQGISYPYKNAIISKKPTKTMFISNPSIQFAETFIPQKHPLRSCFFDTNNKLRTLQEITESIFGFNSKQARKIMVEKVILPEEVDIDLADRLRLVSKVAGIDKNHVFSAMQHWKTVSAVAIEESLALKENLVSELASRYSHKKVSAWLLSHDHPNWEDLQESLSTCLIQSPGSIPEKPDDLMDLHLRLCRIVERKGLPDYSLNQKPDILDLDRRKLGIGNLEIRVPRTDYDLVDLGTELSFCIGNGTYSSLVREGKSHIIALYDGKKPVYGIQFHRFRIQQARGFGNSIIPEDILKKIEEAVLRKPEASSDFCEVDNHFIRGFRYDGNDLYVLFANKGDTYLYKDVPHEVFEQFVEADSMGSFFAKRIRNKYVDEKVSLDFASAPELRM